METYTLSDLLKLDPKQTAKVLGQTVKSRIFRITDIELSEKDAKFMGGVLVECKKGDSIKTKAKNGNKINFYIK